MKPEPCNERTRRHPFVAGTFPLPSNYPGFDDSSELLTAKLALLLRVPFSAEKPAMFTIPIGLD